MKFKPGQRVRHVGVGLGTVIDVDPDGLFLFVLLETPPPGRRRESAYYAAADLCRAVPRPAAAPPIDRWLETWAASA